MEPLLAVGVLLLLARALEELAGRLRLPPFLGNVAAGVVLGGLVSGFIVPTPELRLFAGIGLLMFFFFVGLEEVDLSSLVAVARQRVLYAALIVFTAPFVVALALFWAAGLGAPVSAALASVISIASLSVVAKVLSDLGRLRTPLGLQIFATVAVVELVGLVAFSMAMQAGLGQGLSLWTVVWLAIKVCFFLAVAWIVASQAVPPIMRWTLKHMRSREITLGALFGVMLLFAFLGERSGLHGSIGALLLGVALSKVTTEFHLNVFRGLRGLAYGIFVPLFFASAGLELGWSFTQLPLPIVLGVFGILLLVRPLSALGAVRLTRLAGAWATSVGLLPKGSMELALLISLLNLRLISQEYFSLMTLGVLVVLVTSTLILSPLIKRAVEPSAEEVADEMVPLFGRLALADTTVGDVMEPPEPTVPGETSVAEFIEAHLASGRRVYPVVDSGGRPIGSISVADVKALPRERWAGTKVTEAMAKAFIGVRAEEPLYAVLETMAGHGFPLVIVTNPNDGERVIGIVTRSSILARMASPRRSAVPDLSSV